MQALILTNKGIEESSSKEIKKLIDIKPEEKNGFLIFETKKREDLYKIAYLGRTITRVLEIKSKGNNPFELNYAIDFDKSKKIGIEIVREGEHEFNSADLYEHTTKQIREQGFSFVHKNPEVSLFLYVKDEEAYFCIDYSGFDLGKREYKIFPGNNTIRGNIAAGILIYLNFEKGKLLDPFCKDGTIAIEAALINKNMSPHYYSKEKFLFLEIFGETVEVLERLDKMDEGNAEVIASDANFSNISAAKKNADIATIKKGIRFLKCNIDDIDLKFDLEIEHIVTMPLQPGRNVPENVVEKVAKQLFERAKDAIGKKGKMVLLFKKGEEIYKTKIKGFKLEEEKEIMQGKEKIKVLFLKKI